METEVTTLAILGASGALKPMAETAARLLKSLLGEPFKVAAGMVGDYLYYKRCCNIVSFMQRFAKVSEHEKIDPRVLPTGFLVPLLDAVGNVEDETLQELWARLLASAVADDEHQQPAYVDTLKRMSGQDAKALAEVHRRYVAWRATSTDLSMNVWEVSGIDKAALTRLQSLNLLSARHESWGSPYPDRLCVRDYPSGCLFVTAYFLLFAAAVMPQVPGQPGRKT